jgi:hypothetical protein
LLARNGCGPACDDAERTAGISDLARSNNPAHTPSSATNQEPLQLLADWQGRRLAESDAAYPNLQLNNRWRVIVCRDGIQWILQHRNRAETVSRSDWRGRSYCRAREALIGCCDRFCCEIDPLAAAILQILPEQFAFGEVRA